MSTYFDSLDAVKAELAKCMKCGNCQEVCPIYIETQTEAGVARGKLKLVDALLTGDLGYTEGLSDKLALCLSCYACNAKCPCGVKVNKIILGTRAAIARNKGLHPLKNMIFSVVKRGGLFDFSLKTGSYFQGLAFKKHPSRKAGYPRFPIALDTRRIFPSLATKTFRDSVPSIIKADKPVKKVALFSGCTINYLFPEQGLAVVDVLKANNVDVVIPKDQMCCGAPIYIHGDVPTAKDIAKINIDAFASEEFDALITACGTCGGSWQHYYADLLSDEPEYLEKVKAIAKKTCDIADFIVNVIGLDKSMLGPVKRKVTYHDPCHLNRGMNVNKQPREILKAIPEMELVEMKLNDRCCGGAGSFSLTHYDLAMDIDKRKVNAIRDTKAEQVVTGCGACRMQLTDGLNRFDSDHGVEVLHTMQILAESLEAGKKLSKKAV